MCFIQYDNCLDSRLSNKPIFLNFLFTILLAEQFKTAVESVGKKTFKIKNAESEPKIYSSH